MTNAIRQIRVHAPTTARTCFPVSDAAGIGGTTRRRTLVRTAAVVKASVYVGRVPRAKDSTVGLLVVLASIAMFLAVLSAYARRTLADTDQFANRGTAALRDPAVRALTAERVTDQLVLERRSGLTTVRPLVMRAVSAALGSRAFVNAFRAGLRDVHRALFASDRNTLTLTISHVGPIIAGRLALLHPSAAPAVERANQ